MKRWIVGVLSKLRPSKQLGPGSSKDSGQQEVKARDPETEPTSKSVSTRTESKVALLIGFDFGTHSTKVVIRRRGVRQGRLLALDRAAEGYPSFAVPSVVRVLNGTLCFGTEALRQNSGTLYRFLKLELIRKSGTTSIDCENTDLLVTAYFAWVLNSVKGWIDTEYGIANTKLFLNVAAPMDHFEDDEIKARYLRLLGTAWEWVFDDPAKNVVQYVSEADLKSWMGGTRLTIPESETRVYDVLPETIAPIMSLSQDPRMTPGIYLLVDMGAGTTEMSVNYVPAPGTEEAVLCYFDRSTTIGAEQFLNGQDREQLKSAVLTHLWQTWCYGFKKDGQNQAAKQRWKSLSILLLGGGTCRPDVCDAIKGEKHAVYSRFPQEAKCQIMRHGPANLHCDGLQLSPQDLSLASVANGLAFPRMQWLEFYEPAEVEAIGSTAVQKAREPWFFDR